MIKKNECSKEKHFRHEMKYPISFLEETLIRERINVLMKKDIHVSDKGTYLISSLYFDDYRDTCFFENENGTDPREKIRIRIYNHNLEMIMLECKRKERGKTLKTQCKISLEQAKALAEGKKIESHFDPLLEKVWEQILSRNLRPKVIVEYERIPFVSRNGNVRITFDKCLSSSTQTERFFSGDYIKRPVMPTGVNLLEVKYDSFLPDNIYKALQIDNLQQTAFSKYYLCRKFDV